jgi:PHD/YefM family antitoxin component YafN of YafNO toxin-antitoxin module
MIQPFSVPPTIAARDIQRGYKKVFDTVKKTKRPIVVMANNTPQAAIISLEMLEEYNSLQAEQNAFTLIDEIRAKNRGGNAERVYDDVTKLVEQVRKERHEKTQGNP